MTLLRAFGLLALALICLGCQTERFGAYSHYYEVRVTDPRGVLIADWVAVGAIKRNETHTGYRFRAVERLAAGTHPQAVRYPHGRLVEASGPNIVFARCGEPYWLRALRNSTADTSFK